MLQKDEDYGFTLKLIQFYDSDDNLLLEAGEEEGVEVEELVLQDDERILGFESFYTPDHYKASHLSANFIIGKL